ncbi:hypothetical protein cand_016330 [Cryptosporidium andersoni]|uniref:Uncharacterized protein n=1 Tax=Cryptosporidium andersoni TaxID=117008 RepID=A0A1J4MT94_9CRYT|nr:hypothetical protein cand_016330 [Cryptosporidium andersoni]
MQNFKVKLVLELLIITLFSFRILHSTGKPGILKSNIMKIKNKFRSYEDKILIPHKYESISPLDTEELQFLNESNVMRLSLARDLTRFQEKKRNNKGTIDHSEIEFYDSMFPTYSKNMRVGDSMEPFSSEASMYLWPKNPYNHQGSNIVYSKMSKPIQIDHFGYIISEFDNTINSGKGIKERIYTKVSHSTSIWGVFVSPCYGLITFSQIFSKSLKYDANTCLYRIFCKNSDIIERYSFANGIVTEFMNRKLAHKEDGMIDTSVNYNVSRGDIILRVLEDYNPPLYEEEIFEVPVAMPCSGYVLWAKKPKQVFMTGELIAEINCYSDINKTNSSQLIFASSRGYYDLLNLNYTKYREYSNVTSLKSNFNRSFLPVNSPFATLHLEYKYFISKENKLIGYQNTDNIMIKMPCKGIIRFPTTRLDFVMENEKLYEVKCLNGTTITQQSMLQGSVEMLVSSNTIIEENEYILCISKKDLSKMLLDDFSSKVINTWRMSKEADVMIPILLKFSNNEEWKY